jgi:hypothetical protein
MAPSPQRWDAGILSVIQIVNLKKQRCLPFVDFRYGSPKIPGAVIPHRVFTQPGSLGDVAVRRHDVRLTPESKHRCKQL